MNVNLINLLQRFETPLPFFSIVNLRVNTQPLFQLVTSVLCQTVHVMSVDQQNNYCNKGSREISANV